MTAMTLLKIILSIPVGIGLIYPFLQPDASGGILAELQIFGPVGSLLAIIIFLLLVFFYARDLVNTLQLVAPASRTASPNSVWWMFVLPYNFIEDFFIIANVTKSLEAEAVSNPALGGFRSFGMKSGLGWCSAQVLSLIPNLLGSIAGLVAIFCWVWHWRFIRQVNRALLLSQTS